MSDFKIEKNIEIPLIRRGRDSCYPFKDLKIGDSFFVEGDKKKAGNVRGCMNWFKSKHGFVFASRFRKENKNGKTIIGIRIWRIE